MNALPEMLHCMNTAANIAGRTDMSVFERQRARMKWEEDQQQQQQQLSFFSGNELNMFSIPAAQAQQFQPLIGNESGFNGLVNRAVKPDPGMANGWPDYGKFGGDDHLGYGYGNVNGIELNYAISRTTSCPPEVAVSIAEVAGADTKQREEILPEKMSSPVGKESFKKRKTDKTHNQKVTEDEGIKEKKIKGGAEEGDSKITTEQNKNCNKRETSNDTSKDNSKISEVQKSDYIHVRARRGQATDSHSLAERVRREKISERMKYLQDLVPGCNKITGKAGMLDEIINYVQSLQRQVEFLSMKLAAVNPRLDFNVDNLFTKEIFPACTSNFPTGLSPEMANPAYFQFNPLQQAITCCGLDLGVNPPDMALRRTISAPVSISETFVDSSGFNPPATWDADLQNLYNAEFQQGRSTTYPPQLFTGTNNY